ncbi:hypothetical protein AW168_35340 [Nocardia brasiliensis]|nr:hypothetical protein AW168_35340 [Nocardia brasiliensis]
MQSPTRTQNTFHLCGHGDLRLGSEVVQHHRGQHTIEFVVRIGQSLGVAAIESDPGSLGRLLLGQGQCSRVGVGSDNDGTGLVGIGTQDEVAGAAADLEDLMSCFQFSLADEFIVEPVYAQQPGAEIIDRQQQAIACRGQIVERATN